MEEFQKYFSQTTFHHHFQARNANISPIFHFYRVNNGRICHILNVKFLVRQSLYRKSYPKSVSESGRFLVNSSNVDAKAVFDASTDHEAKIVVHNQFKGHLDAESKAKFIAPCENDYQPFFYNNKEPLKICLLLYLTSFFVCRKWLDEKLLSCIATFYVIVKKSQFGRITHGCLYRDVLETSMNYYEHTKCH